MLDIDIRTNLREMQRRMTLLEVEQIPYATALALSSLAGEVKDAEVASMATAFDRPTPFTQRSMGIVPARKDRLYAKIYIKDIAAEYLEPFEFGGPHVLGQKQGLLKPVGQGTNAYGNLSQGTVARLSGRANVFIGGVETKGGKTIRGVWERVGVTAKGKAKRKAPRGMMYSAAHGRLRLLIRFTDPGEVTQAWGYRNRARDVVGRRYAAAFTAAMARALA